MVFWKAKPAAPRGPESALLQVVRAALPGSDAETHHVVAAVAGLLTCVAHADHTLADSELAFIRAELARIEGLGPSAVQAIVDVMRTQAATIALVDDHRWARSLKEHATRELRVEVLEVLVDLAAADGEVSAQETTLLRRIVDAMGLTQADYVSAQERHRDKLSVLKRPG